MRHVEPSGAFGPAPLLPAAAYVAAGRVADAVPAPGAYPPCDWTEATPWDPLGNDVCGDCVLAGVFHLAQARAAANGAVLVPTAAEAEAAYKQVNPDFVLGQRIGDTGSQPANVLRILMTTGMTIGGRLHRIRGAATIKAGDVDELRYAVLYGGGALSVVDLPLSAQVMDFYDIAGAGQQPLTGSWAPGSWGAHAWATLAEAPRVFKGISWGESIGFTPRWWNAYGMISYMLVWEGLELPGVNAERLEADLALLRAGFA